MPHAALYNPHGCVDDPVASQTYSQSDAPCAVSFSHFAKRRLKKKKTLKKKQK